MVVLVVILASLLFLDLAGDAWDVGVLRLGVRIPQLVSNRACMVANLMLTANMMAVVSIVLAVLWAAEFVWLAGLLIALISWGICIIVCSHAYVFKIDIIIHIIELCLALRAWVELCEHVEFVVNVLGGISLCVSIELVVGWAFASLLLNLHLHARSRFPTLSLWCWWVWYNITIVLLNCKVVILPVTHPSDLVLLDIVALKLINGPSFFVLFADGDVVLVAGAATQPAKLVQRRWIPNILLIFILHDYLPE